MSHPKQVKQAREMLSNLRSMLCAYIGDRCDCKYIDFDPNIGVGRTAYKSREQTGCCEIRFALSVIEGLANTKVKGRVYPFSVFAVHDRVQNTTKTLVGTVTQVIPSQTTVTWDNGGVTIFDPNCKNSNLVYIGEKLTKSREEQKRELFVRRPPMRVKKQKAEIAKDFKFNGDFKHDAQSIICPRCEAPVGKSCPVFGKNKPGIHVERRRAFFVSLDAKTIKERYPQWDGTI